MYNNTVSDAKMGSVVLKGVSVDTRGYLPVYPVDLYALRFSRQLMVPRDQGFRLLRGDEIRDLVENHASQGLKIKCHLSLILCSKVS